MQSKGLGGGNPPKQNLEREFYGRVPHNTGVNAEDEVDLLLGTVIG